jgi:hypothetical protein
MTDEGRQFFGFEPGEPLITPPWADASTPRIARRGRRRSSTRLRLAVLTRPSFASTCPMVRCDGSPRGAAAPAAPEMAQLREYAASRWTLRGKSRLMRRRRSSGRNWRIFPRGRPEPLSGSLAHELKQPLASILSNAQAGQRFMSRTSPTSASFAPSSRTSSARTAARERSSSACAPCCAAARSRSSR